MRFETIVKMGIRVAKSVNPDPCIFAWLTKFYYLCIVNQRKGKMPMARAKYFVAYQKKIAGEPDSRTKPHPDPLLQRGRMRDNEKYLRVKGLRSKV